MCKRKHHFEPALGCARPATRRQGVLAQYLVELEIACIHSECTSGSVTCPKVETSSCRAHGRITNLRQPHGKSGPSSASQSTRLLAWASRPVQNVDEGIFDWGGTQPGEGILPHKSMSHSSSGHETDAEIDGFERLRRVGSKNASNFAMEAGVPSVTKAWNTGFFRHNVESAGFGTQDRLL